jgi:energy-coupling factor transporter ATP-binding protein EcfA2
VSTINDLNEFLTERKFKYRYFEDSQTAYLSLPGQPEYRGLVPSPGENFHLMSLLWVYYRKLTLSQSHPMPPSILLLDEPDVGTHPKLAKEIIDIIKNTLIGEYGIQVILVTHNPIIIHWIPSECLYLMSNTNGKAKITHITTPKLAVQLLTGDLICINDPFLYVMVEGDMDAKVYDYIYRRLMNLVSKGLLTGVLGSDNIPLIFKVHGRMKNRASRQEVIDVVKEYTHIDDIRGDPEHSTLSEFIFGIVDGDNKDKESHPNIQCLDRYAIESYLFDPIHVFFQLQGLERSLFNKLPKELRDILDEISFPKSVDELWELENSQQEQLLQSILDRMFQIFICRLEGMLNTPDNNIKENLKRCGLYTQGSGLIKDKETNDHGIPIYTTLLFGDNRVNLRYSILLKRMDAKDIRNIYIQWLRDLGNHEKITNNMIDFCRDNFLPFKAIIDIYTCLLNLPPRHNRSFDERKASERRLESISLNDCKRLIISSEGKNKRLETEKHTIIKNYKEKLKEKDAVIKNYEQSVLNRYVVSFILGGLISYVIMKMRK